MARGNLIAGEWVDAKATVAGMNPSDLADVVDEFAVADESQVDAAIEAATAAAPVWAAVTPAERFAVLERVGLELEARAGELGEQLSKEEGKPRGEGGPRACGRRRSSGSSRARRCGCPASTCGACAPASTSTCCESRSASSA